MNGLYRPNFNKATPNTNLVTKFWGELLVGANPFKQLVDMFRAIDKVAKKPQIIYFLDKLTLHHVSNNYHHVTIMSYHNGDVINGRDGFPRKFILEFESSNDYKKG